MNTEFDDNDDFEDKLHSIIIDPRELEEALAQIQREEDEREKADFKAKALRAREVRLENMKRNTETEKVFNDTKLSEKFLRVAAQTSNLVDLKSIELVLNTEELAIDDLGTFLPNLKALKLNDCTLGSVRDIGRSYSNLQVLWMGQCSLRDLDGIEYLKTLRELYVPFNSISELEPVSLPLLETLDVFGNLINLPDTLDFLGYCPRLKYLKLDNNPICAREHYRAIVCARVSSLAILDDIPVTDDDRLDLDPQGRMHNMSSIV
jgi:hypothetical protein